MLRSSGSLTSLRHLVALAAPAMLQPLALGSLNHVEILDTASNYYANVTCIQIQRIYTAMQCYFPK